MNLNNRGWGYSTMIICVCFILLMLLVIVYYVYLLNQSIEDEKEVSREKGYEQYIAGMEQSSINYAMTYLENLDDNFVVVIKLEELINLDMQEPYNDCEGYVNLKKVKENYETKGYLKCSDYLTEGYGE